MVTGQVILESNVDEVLDTIEGAGGAKGTSVPDRDTFDDWINNMSPEDAARYNEWHNVRDAGCDIPWEDYLSLRDVSVKNPNGDSMTLGKYFKDADGNATIDAYTLKAQSTGDTYFDLGER